MKFTRRQAIISSIGTVISATAVSANTQVGGEVVLLGDSIFDNQRYVEDGQSTIDKVRATLPQAWKAKLLAKDGAVVTEVQKQRQNVNLHGKYVFVSAGGNDALKKKDILNMNLRVANSKEVFTALADIRDKFFLEYSEMTKAIVTLGGNTTLCTIYNPNYQDMERQRMAETALTVFNDCIIRVAYMFNLPILDLRIAFNNRSYYANPIEPSATGGELIANLILKIVERHNFKNDGVRLYADLVRAGRNC